MSNYRFDGHKLFYHPDRTATFLANGDCYPLYLEISPVGSCNHRCIFCAYDFIGYPNRRLDTGRTLRFLDEIAACGVRSVLFAGEGEPLLHPEIARLVTHAKGCGIDVGMFSNGQLLKEALAREILPALTFLRFSFNGGTRENYAAMHKVRPEAFDTVVANIARAAAIKAEEGLEVDLGAQFVVLPENLDRLPDACAVLKEAGINYLAVKPFVQQSALQGYQMTASLDPDRLEAAFALAEAHSDDSFQVVARRDSFQHYGVRNYDHCLGTSFISVLNSAGELATCLPYWEKEEAVFGNINEGSFTEIWNGERRKAILKHLQCTLDAHGCPPNCRANAINEFLWELSNPQVKHVNFI